MAALAMNRILPPILLFHPNLSWSWCLFNVAYRHRHPLSPSWHSSLKQCRCTLRSGTSGWCARKRQFRLAKILIHCLLVLDGLE